jgi:hypothetical protein
MEWLLALPRFKMWQIGMCPHVSDLRSFLGLARYYIKFVHHFGNISIPLTYLLKKNSVFVWTQEHEMAFQTLKTTLV